MFQVGLRYLTKVLQIEKHSLQQQSTLASTYLNISSLLSNLNKHRESFGFSVKANQMFLDLKEQSMQRGTNPEPFEISGLIASYLNLAVNCENLGNIRKAVKFANEGYHFALMDLGPRHPTSQNLKTFLDRLSIKAENATHHLPRKDDHETHNFGNYKFYASSQFDNRSLFRI